MATVIRGKKGMSQTRSSVSGFILLSFTLYLVLSLTAFAADSSNLNTFVGNVTIGGSYAANGVVVDAFIGSASSPATGGSYIVGSKNIFPVNFTMDFACTAGSTVFLKVWGINASTQTCINGQLQNFTNLSVSLTANDGACSYANACSGGSCCSGGITAVNSSTSSGVCQAVACGTGITIPAFSLGASSITTSQTVNFTINITSQVRHNITAANFSLVTPSGNITRNFTIPSNGRNFNLSYKIFNSAETAAAGTYNVTAVMVTDNGSVTNLTVITNMNFTVTAAATTTTDTGGGGSSSSGGGGSSGGGTPATTPAQAPSKETVDAVKEALPDTFKVAAESGNVEYKTVAAPESKDVPAGGEKAASTIDYAVDYLAKTEPAQKELNSIQEAVSSGGATTVQAAGGSVTKTIEVVKATNKVTKEEAVVSVVKLSVVAPADKPLKNVEVVEVIPKLAASNVNQVSFKGEQPIVLEADPVVKWFFSEVGKGQKKDLSYAINKDIRNVGTSTVAVQGRAEATPPQTPPPAPAVPEKKEEGGGIPTEVKKPRPFDAIILVVVVAVAVVGGWFFIRSRKKAMK
ncbi:hypothetical protein HYU18_05130 [Candidatus Woesearchaeota archaeon]|nr:hypothetical protein [Candidatus Woesearchaeota archaeon]